MIPTFEDWDAHAIHGTQEQSEQILAIAHKTQAISTKIVNRELCSGKRSKRSANEPHWTTNAEKGKVRYTHDPHF